MENKHIESKTKQNIVINFFLVKKICVAYPYYSNRMNTDKKIQIKKNPVIIWDPNEVGG
jgi:hypothetical protein